MSFCFINLFVTIWCKDNKLIIYLRDHIETNVWKFMSSLYVIFFYNLCVTIWCKDNKLIISYLISASSFVWERGLQQDSRQHKLKSLIIWRLTAVILSNCIFRWRNCLWIADILTDMCDFFDLLHSRCHRIVVVIPSCSKSKRGVFIYIYIYISFCEEAKMLSTHAFTMKWLIQTRGWGNSFKWWYRWTGGWKKKTKKEIRIAVSSILQKSSPISVYSNDHFHSTPFGCLISHSA
jgi:hypothetical protein